MPLLISLNFFLILQARKEAASAHLKEIDERSFQLTLELAKIKKNREEGEQRYGTELKDLVSKIAIQVE